MNMGQDASGVRRWPVVCGVGRWCAALAGRKRGVRKEAGRPGRGTVNNETLIVYRARE
jgi:hypothetical protein